MCRLVFGSILFFLATALGFAAELKQKERIDGKPGILVELFTSEGCSSCPPADALLRKLDSQPISERSNIIILGEHVDYWDRSGWRDRFSSPDYTRRQEEYARKFSLDGPYTPQMVVDGNEQFVGNDAGALASALGKAEVQPKALIRVSVDSRTGDKIEISVEIGGLPRDNKSADLYVATVDSGDETEVKAGENAGRRLLHVAVVRSLRKVGIVEGKSPTISHIALHLPQSRAANGRIVAFVQEANNGAVLGSAAEVLKPSLAIR